MLNAVVKDFLNHGGLSSPKLMDELTQHRKRRLQALIDGKPYLGNQSAFALKAGLTKGRVSQLLDPAQSFGERAGMKLAAALGLRNERYFDSDQEPTTTDYPAEADQLAEALEVLTKALRKADKNSRLALEPLLSSMAKEPEDAGQKSRLILRLLITDTVPAIPAENDRPGHISGDLGILDLGDRDNGRSDRVAAKGGSKR